MAITFPSINSNEGDGNTVTVSHTVSGADKVLIVCVILEVTDADKEVGSVVWDVATLNEDFGAAVHQFKPSHAKLAIEIFRLINPSDGGPLLVTVTIEGGGSQKMGVCVMTANGANQTTALEDFTDQEANDAAPGPVTVPNDVSGDFVIDAAGFFEDRNPNVGANQTENFDEGVQGAFRAFGSRQPGADGGVMSWTMDGSGDKENAIVGFNLRVEPPAAEVDQPRLEDPQGISRDLVVRAF